MLLSAPLIQQGTGAAPNKNTEKHDNTGMGSFTDIRQELTDRHPRSNTQPEEDTYQASEQMQKVDDLGLKN